MSASRTSCAENFSTSALTAAMTVTTAHVGSENTMITAIASSSDHKLRKSRRTHSFLLRPVSPTVRGTRRR